MTDADDDGRMSGKSRIGMGECYLTALKLLIAQRESLGDAVTLIDPPANMLAGFALELLLKGYLLLKGEPPAVVRSYGHKIDRLVDRARKLGLPDVDGLPELIDTLGRGHADFTYRYIEPGQMIGVFHWDRVLPIFERLYVPITRAIEESGLR